MGEFFGCKITCVSKELGRIRLGHCSICQASNAARAACLFTLLHFQSLSLPLSPPPVFVSLFNTDLDLASCSRSLTVIKKVAGTFPPAYMRPEACRSPAK
jgi:hypothetical protein